jgi:hypothetical protein
VLELVDDDEHADDDMKTAAAPANSAAARTRVMALMCLFCTDLPVRAIAASDLGITIAN